MAKKVVSRVTNRVIAYAFAVGVFVALILGLISASLSASSVAVLTSILIIAGIVVGFFNITHDERKDYILFVTALVIVASLSKGVLGSVQIVGPYLESVFASIMAFIVPSVIIVGLRAIMSLARE
ncbi:hypothetical protein HOL21_01025 [Candidatus Woesearchaeota archaeon]|jgi:hypothetical protein|nr:hypothetical protein [Candidatus Woesearchaeota archaeon]MBT5396777.1 hypothetical protein [Candidatus Woesearchaeota archaeon]MBT5924523.1 hypothetical protein [Candidatus Woesearchaeota archaeon]MBT6367665.1 hypothetical protein [Candidatus Woesearchaeota archaeon]MBT7762934.1 hypothetical protein [Candidatus Woesearchaeota archaeon]